MFKGFILLGLAIFFAFFAYRIAPEVISPDGAMANFIGRLFGN